MAAEIFSDILYASRFSIWAVLAGITAVLLYIRNEKKDRQNLKTGLLWFLMAGYLAMVVITTLFSRDSGAFGGVDLVPFSTYGVTERTHVMFWENMILLVPYGILLPLLWKGKKWWQYLLCGTCFSILIEIVQFITQRGMAQTDDVIMNSIGMLIGIGIVSGIQKLKKPHHL